MRTHLDDPMMSEETQQWLYRATFAQRPAYIDEHGREHEEKYIEIWTVTGSGTEYEHALLARITHVQHAVFLYRMCQNGDWDGCAVDELFDHDCKEGVCEIMGDGDPKNDKEMVETIYEELTNMFRSFSPRHHIDVDGNFVRHPFTVRSSNQTTYNTGGE